MPRGTASRRTGAHLMNESLMSFIRGNGLFLLVLLALVGGFLVLRTKGTKLASWDEFDAAISAGQPVVAEVYSNT